MTYSDQKCSNGFYRRFSSNVNSKELVWHRDHRNRLVEIISGVGWRFQFDNELPFEINERDTLFVPENEFHRILKGSTELVLFIQEF